MQIINYLQGLLKNREYSLGEIIIFHHDNYRIQHINSVNPKEIKLEDLRWHIRFNKDGKYRPLSGSKDLKNDWFLALNSIEEVYEAIETIYPLVLHHDYQYKNKTLRIIQPEVTLEKQTGKFAKVANLTKEQIKEAEKTICSKCIRNPVWNNQFREKGICPEVCSFFISTIAVFEIK